jgi:serpin B
MIVRASSQRRPKRSAPSVPAAARMWLEPLEPRTFFSATPAATPADLVAQANNAFAFDLFHELNHTHSGNLFFSPYSIATALEMTLQGAKGATASEIIQALHLPSSQLAQAGIQALYQLFQADPATAGYTLSTANRLWVNDNFPLLNSFLSSERNLFGADPQTVDFSDPAAAAATINAWVAAQTHGKITDLISPDKIRALARLILTNAIYFKGDWTSSFNSNLTHDASFQESSSQTATVHMMEQTNDFGYYARPGPNGFQALDLPYQGNNIDMLVILPTASNLDAFQSSLSPELFSQITTNLAGTDVNVDLPKFKLDESYDLQTPLQNLGIHTAFSGQADFSGIAPEKLKITDVVQKSFIQVDETGTEATAATGIVATPTAVLGFQPIPVSFNADHPFLVAIRDRGTNTILFLGRVTDSGGASANAAPPASVSQPAPPTDPATTSPVAAVMPAIGFTAAANSPPASAGNPSVAQQVLQASSSTNSDLLDSKTN